MERQELFSVEGIVAVITGGGTGIGLMMAKALATNGAAKVYVVGRREDVLRRAAHLHPSIIPLPGDVTKQDDLEHLAQRVKEEVGYVNLVVANAGITGPGLQELQRGCTLSEYVKLAWNTPMDDFNAVYALNCTATYYTVLAFLELLDEGNQRKTYVRSQVIATASCASFLRNPMAGYAYCSSKAGLVSMMKCFSTFCVPWGIRFNVIAAGLFPSDLSNSMFDHFVINRSIPITQEGAFARSWQPAERAGSDDDMAGLILYMTSKAGSFLNGSVLLSDGGKVATMPSTY
ncbi:NAD(P)-binding protein [Plenodomus tracheiphilus IPT5]|uniref:NAD(P)-binding protein n=1 Tax=Plenodomus tracheiphilus IPT5 TaxID=1408161 RepID=A0A6A7BBZ2_9PLEO|nr:NAD(P)-binding protein [Plenodomus tracheiphilus IPT5]